LNQWFEKFNIPYPECKMTGQCCKCASPSIPAVKLFQKAAEGDEFAREFFSIFIPYKNIEEARKVNKGIVERSLNACNNPKNKISAKELVFYHCRYISNDNKCLVYEDRPQLCRDFPDTPFLIFAPGCAYEGWAQECKIRYKELQENLKALKQQKKELEELKFQQKALKKAYYIQKINNPECNFMILFPEFCVISPGKSWLSNRI